MALSDSWLKANNGKKRDAVQEVIDWHHLHTEEQIILAISSCSGNECMQHVIGVCSSPTSESTAGA